MLELEPLGRGLDHQLARGQRVQGVHWLKAGGGRVRLLGAEPPLGRFFGQAVPCALSAALERVGERVVQQRARARAGGQLGDSGTHRAGTHDADDTRG